MFTDNRTNNTDWNVEKFVLNDTSGISRIVLKAGKKTVELKRNLNQWTINNKYQADPYLSGLLKAVMKMVAVKRKISKINSPQVVNKLKNEGVTVEIYDQQGIISSFLAGGNDTKTESYFMRIDENQPYIVSIPGYNSFISGIFFLDESGWRDKTIISASWRSLTALEMSYGDSERSFKIKSDNAFFYIEDLPYIDTLKVMEYLKAFEDLRADRFITLEEDLVYDSLALTSPMGKLNLKQIDTTSNNTLLFFPSIDGGKSNLGKLERENQWFLIRNRKAGTILKVKQDFKKEQ